MSDPITLVSLAAGLMGTVTVAVALLRFAASRKQAAIDRGRGRGLLDAAVSSLQAAIDHHQDKIGELDDRVQTTEAAIVQVKTALEWLQKWAERLEGKVDRMRGGDG
jgi:chromosome segregation ATPase